MGREDDEDQAEFEFMAAKELLGDQDE